MNILLNVLTIRTKIRLVGTGRITNNIFLRSRKTMWFQTNLWKLIANDKEKQMKLKYFLKAITKI